jgi:mono/diheme cytochrome c family protein
MAVVAVAAVLLACQSATDDDGKDGGAAAPPAVEPRALGLYSTELPEGTRDQARDALAHDARLRELRFLDATRPGYLFATTRIEQEEIDAGRWPTAALFDVGGTLFHLPFTRALGHGGADLPPHGRVQAGERGGPDAQRCADCHRRGGPAGAGSAADNAFLAGDGDDVTGALARNPIALAGAGAIEALAAEMTRDLARTRDEARSRARREGAPASVELRTKGVTFGRLTAQPDGSIDAAVEGIDPDLVVRPFGWKGTYASVRDAVESSLLLHLGIESEQLERAGTAERVGGGPPDDRDRDGVKREITEGQLTALTLYVALQPVPQILPSDDADVVSRWAAGRNRFAAIGCAGCHVPALRLESPHLAVPSRAGAGAVTVDLTREAAVPRVERQRETDALDVYLFSDLKRHDLGPELAEPRSDRGVPGATFLTRPLWGLARSAPYLHDGRAPTLEDAILAHGGEAAPSRARYAALAEHERGEIRTFLTSLTHARRLVTR